MSRRLGTVHLGTGGHFIVDGYVREAPEGVRAANLDALRASIRRRLADGNRIVDASYFGDNGLASRFLNDELSLHEAGPGQRNLPPLVRFFRGMTDAQFEQQIQRLVTLRDGGVISQDGHPHVAQDTGLGVAGSRAILLPLNASP